MKSKLIRSKVTLNPAEKAMEKIRRTAGNVETYMKLATVSRRGTTQKTPVFTRRHGMHAKKMKLSETIALTVAPADSEFIEVNGIRLSRADIYRSYNILKGMRPYAKGYTPMLIDFDMSIYKDAPSLLAAFGYWAKLNRMEVPACELSGGVDIKLWDSTVYHIKEAGNDEVHRCGFSTAPGERYLQHCRSIFKKAKRKADLAILVAFSLSGYPGEQKFFKSLKKVFNGSFYAPDKASKEMIHEFCFPIRGFNVIPGEERGEKLPSLMHGARYDITEYVEQMDRVMKQAKDN